MIAVGDNSLAPLVDLALRLWVGMVFFNSGLTKIANWDSTLSLFQFEYQVPLLPPELAAWLGTGAELVLPLFLVLGLGGRLAAAALFAFNIVAVVSYPDLSELGLNDHQVWGLMLLATLARGPGKLSIDHFIRGRFEPRTGAHS
ncbi:MAG: DoxX family protein [Betaproteobacteria bacterium]|nr:DoxX family protein [Betaproteobacteria bacterium]